MLAEAPDALWFHVLRSANNATIKGLLHTLDEAISSLSDPLLLSAYLAPGTTVEPHAKTIVFHVCILHPGMTISIHRPLDYVPGRPSGEFFAIAVKAGRTSLEIADGQGWSVHRRTAASVS